MKKTITVLGYMVAAACLAGCSMHAARKAGATVGDLGKGDAYGMLLAPVVYPVAYVAYANSTEVKLLEAIDRGDEEAVRAIIAEKKVKAAAMTAALCRAVYKEQSGLARFLAERGNAMERGFVGKKEKRTGFTPLQYAVQSDNPDNCALLIEKGANPDERYKKEWTPLIFAAFHGKARAAQALIQKGATINAVNAGGATALYIAVNRENVSLVRLLVEAGADASIATKKGGNARALAQKKGNAEMLALLGNAAW